MAIVCIKIGENEPSTYPKFDKLSKHLDIIEVLPRKRDKDGKIIKRTIGVQGDKEYLGIEVDMDDLTDEEFEQARALLRGQHLEEVIVEGRTKQNILQKRLHKIDLSKLSLPKATLDLLAECADKRRTKQPYDLTDINKEHYKTKLPLATIFEVAIDKVQNKSIAVKLDVATKGAKVALQDYIQVMKQPKVEK